MALYLSLNECFAPGLFFLIASWAQLFGLLLQFYVIPVIKWVNTIHLVLTVFSVI